jgi:hypothetical protein
MRIVGCGLVAVAALLGPAPAAMAAQPAAPEGTSAQTAGSAHTAESTQNSAAPENEVSLLAVTLTAGGAIAAAGSGMALVVTRRREVSRRPSRESV